jgi:SlyX protein
MSDPIKNSKRITDLEMSIAHLQKDFETLNEVVLDQGKLIDKLSSRIDKLLSQFEASQEEPEVRDLIDEKPPHY